MAEPVGVSVVVVAADAADRLGALLDALADELATRPRETIVVDRLSSDGTADIALGRPDVHRVVLATQVDPGVAFEHGVLRSTGQILCLLEADGPALPEGWIERGIAQVTSGMDLVTPAVDTGAGRIHGTVCRRAVALRLGIADGGPSDHAGVRLRARAVAGGLAVTGAEGRSIHSRPPIDVVTVAVCTDGRRVDALTRCLDSIAKLEDDNVEVLVVENTQAPRLSPVLAGWGVRHVHEPRRGLDVARNRAIEEATGDVVAFVDDDCEVDPGWVTGLRRAFDESPVALVTGRVVPASLASPSAQWFEAWFSFDRGPTPDRFTRFDRRDWFPFFPSPLGTGCNMAFHKATFSRVARFDPALDMGTPIGGGGDLDIFAQFLDAGEVGAYAPDAIVRHHHRATPRDLRRQFFGYGATQGALCCKYALGRPGQRRQAVRFFSWRLGEHRRRSRAVRNGHDRFPVTLIRAEATGQLAGPFLYLWSRMTRST